MKKMLLLFIFLTAGVQAQIINIPDPAFKARLLSSNASNSVALDNQNHSLTIDANGNGEIEVSEVAAIYVLNVGNSQIASLEGISAFTNVKIMRCNDNLLTALDVSGMGFFIVECNRNQLTSINLSDMPSLYDLNVSENLLTSLPTQDMGTVHTLFCNDNQLTQLQLSDMPHLYEIECRNNHLTSFDASGLAELTLVTCADNQISQLNVSGCTQLYQLWAHYNPLTSLDVSGLTHLNSVTASSHTANGPMTSVNASGCTMLHDLSVDDNSLTSLNVSGCSNLVILSATSNNLTTVDISDCHALIFIFLQHNQLQSLDLSNAPHLVNFKVDYNQIAEIDFSNCPEMLVAEMNNNPLLTRVFAKNGERENLEFANTPQLAYLCVDESQMEEVQEQIGPSSNILINSYCSFTPGGTFNTISGHLTFDVAGDGCDAADAALPMANLNITDGTVTGNEFSDNQGAFAFFMGQGSHTITPLFENPGYFAVTPESATVDFSDANGNSADVDFCVKALGVHNDLEIAIVPQGIARPGFDANYQLIYRNKGNQILSGTVALGYDGALLDLLGSTPAAIGNTDGQLSFGYSNLMPYQQRSIHVTFHLHSPTQTPPANAGETLGFTAAIDPVAADETPNDNVFPLRQTIVNSMDPNDKECLEGDHADVSQIGDYLHYVIRFENTGNAAAQNVVVKDVIDSEKFDTASFQLLSASHPVDVRMAGNKIEFIFEGINLEPDQHGHVVFKVKTRNTLHANDAVTNKADIFFDYNFPVETNTATTTFELLQTNEFTADASVAIDPNPASDWINIRSDSTVQSVELFDGNGRILSHIGHEQRIDVSKYATGIYYAKVKTDRGVKIEKLIKK